MGVIYAKGVHKEAKRTSSVTQKVQASVDAPPLKVTGITGGTQPIAIVNNEIVKEGDEINGAKVVKINKDTVTFEYDGKVIVKELK
jgi:type II secretory pathway component PulC